MEGIKIRKPKIRLKEILKEQGRYSKWLAEQLGVSAHSVQMWCGKRYCPDTETLSKIAELLDIKKSELFEQSEGWSRFLPPIFKP